MPKEPKPPKLSASKEAHKRFAKEVLDYEPYKKEPEGGMHPTDDPDEDKDYQPGDDQS